MVSLWRLIFGGGARDLVTAATNTVRVVRGDRAAQDAQAAAALEGALGQFGAEFGATARRTWFDALVDGLNRLPRPFLAFATMALFAYAFHAPVEFAARMQALALVPDQLWYLMGAVIAFYFGAREFHHRRARAAPDAGQVRAAVDAIQQIQAIRPPIRAAPETEIQPDAAPLEGAPGSTGNAALADWRAKAR